MCRGGPGALNMGNIGTYHANPVTTDPADAADLKARLARRIASGLEPGAVLQYWNDQAEFEKVIQRTDGSPSGHSPIFQKYEGPANAPTKLILIDQSGDDQEYDINRTNGQVTDIGGADIWIAANWIE